MCVIPIHYFGQTPVHDVDLTEISHHDVARFQVAVDDSLGMGVVDAIADFHEHTQQLRYAARVDGLEMFLLLFLNGLSQRGTFHHFHGEIDLAPRIGAQLMDRADVGMLQLSLHLYFFYEAFHRRRRGSNPAGNDFHGHLTADVCVQRVENYTHAAPGNFPGDKVFFIAPMKVGFSSQLFTG